MLLESVLVLIYKYYLRENSIKSKPILENIKSKLLCIDFRYARFNLFGIYFSFQNSGLDSILLNKYSQADPKFKIEYILEMCETIFNIYLMLNRIKIKLNDNPNDWQSINYEFGEIAVYLSVLEINIKEFEYLLDELSKHYLYLFLTNPVFYTNY